MPLRADLGTLLARQAAERPDAPFVTIAETGERRTYGEFDAEVNRVATGLRELGVGQGDFVAVMLSNSLEALLVSYALKKLGAVEVAINYEFRGVGLARMIDLTPASLLVTESEFCEHVAAVVDDVPRLERVVVVGPSGAIGGKEVIAFGRLLASGADAPECHVADTDLATVIFTSGTTGVSKGCLLSHRLLVRSAEAVVGPLGLTADDCVYTPYPLYHLRAAYLDILPVVLVGGQVVVARRFSASRFWPHMHDFGVTCFSLLGTVMQILWNRAEEPAERGHRVRVTWGGPISVDRHAFEQRFGIPVLPGEGVYGMTEIGLVSMSWFGPARGTGIGEAWEVRIGDDEDGEVPRGELGEILVRPREPSTVFAGYYGRPDATVAVCRNLWFHTGDLGRMDAHGRLLFVGRKKDMIRRGGHNISTWEIEEIVGSHDGVAECVAVGVPAPLGEEQVLVAVVAREGAELDAAELRAFCAERMAAFMVPDHVRVLDEIPTTSTGKPAKAALAQLVVS